MRRFLIILAAVTSYLSLSGFDCASTEMTTAKLAVKSKDYAKAEGALTKEVTLRPTNGEAWLLLGDIYNDQGRYSDMKNAYEKALRDGNQPAISAEDKRNVSVKMYNAWLTKYNSALENYNKGLDTKDNARIQRAVDLLDTAEILRPGYPENTFLRATIFRELGNEAREREELNRYIQVIEPNLNAGISAGLALNMTESAVEAKLGAPTRKKVDSTGGWAYYQSRNLWVYYAPKDGVSRLEGWRVVTTPEPELFSQLPYQIRSYPEYMLGIEAFRAGDKEKARYDEALRRLERVVRYDPERPGVGDVVARIYVNTGRTSEARTALEGQIRSNPSDPAPYIAYGTLLFNSNDYSGAAEYFKKVLGLGLPDSDDRVQVALFNIGAAYKNLGKQVQDSIMKVSKDRPSAAQTTVFQRPLRDAMTYFERLKNEKAKEGDFAVLAELANIYDILGENAKVKSAIREIEAVEKLNDNENNPTYWITLRRLYAITGDVDKSNAADRKVRELGAE